MKKITTQEQVNGLKTGNAITRYPPYSNMQQEFDAKEVKSINVFEIKTINTLTGMMGLISTDNHKDYLSGSPVYVGRLNIKSAELMDGYWWI